MGVGAGGGFGERALFKETVNGILIALLRNYVYMHWRERKGQTNTVDKKIICPVFIRKDQSHEIG